MQEKDIAKLPKGMTREKLEKIQAQIQKEYKEGVEFYEKNMAYRKDNAKYLLGETSNKKVHVRSILSILTSLQSIFFNDKRKIDFSAVFSDGDYIAETYNVLANYDYKKMKKHKFDWLKVTFGFMFGMGITRIKGWDKKKNLPILEHIHTLSAIVDPFEIKEGGERRYFGCFKWVLLKEIEKDKRFINTQSINTKEVEKDRIKLYNHYTIFDRKIYLTTWTNEVKNLIKIEEFEEEGPLQDTFGVSIFEPYPMIERGGADLIELGAEYQKFLSQIINLMLIQSKKDVLGEDRIVDTNKVDFKDLQKQEVGGKDIPIELEPGEDIHNIIATIPKEQSGYKADSGIAQLRYLLQESTAVPDIVQGVMPQKDVTKGELQQAQINSNGKFGTISSFLLLSEEDFWRSYQLFYRYCFSGEKNISIKNKYATDYYVITRKDIYSKDFIDFNVVVESRAEKQAKNSTIFNKMTVLLPFSMPMMGEYEKVIALRDYWEYAGIERDEIYGRFPESVDEMRARQHLELLNRNKDVPAPEPGEDHKTYLIIYQQGIPTPANRKAVTLRKMMLMNQPKQIQAQDNMQNMQNISQAQAGNAIIQENNQNLASNEDVNV